MRGAWELLLEKAGSVTNVVFLGTEPGKRKSQLIRFPVTCPATLCRGQAAFATDWAFTLPHPE